MNKVSGLITSEIVTLVLAVAIFIAVGFGLYVSSERNRMVESAEASLAAIKQQATAASESGTLIACDNSMVEAEVLANEFIELTIKPILIDESKPEDGFGAGIYVSSNQKSDGSDTFVTAERLYDLVKEKETDELREIKKEDEDIEYFVLVSESASCINMGQLATTTPTTSS